LTGLLRAALIDSSFHYQPFTVMAVHLARSDRSRAAPLAAAADVAAAASAAVSRERAGRLLWSAVAARLAAARVGTRDQDGEGKDLALFTAHQIAFAGDVYGPLCRDLASHAPALRQILAVLTERVRPDGGGGGWDGRGEDTVSNCLRLLQGAVDADPDATLAGVGTAAALAAPLLAVLAGAPSFLEAGRMPRNRRRPAWYRCAPWGRGGDCVGAGLSGGRCRRAARRRRDEGARA
jgi:hypothetical protein